MAYTPSSLIIVLISSDVSSDLPEVFEICLSFHFNCLMDHIHAMMNTIHNAKKIIPSNHSRLSQIKIPQQIVEKIPERIDIQARIYRKVFI